MFEDYFNVLTLFHGRFFFVLVPHHLCQLCGTLCTVPTLQPISTSQPHHINPCWGDSPKRVRYLNYTKMIYQSPGTRHKPHPQMVLVVESQSTRVFDSSTRCLKPKVTFCDILLVLNMWEEHDMMIMCGHVSLLLRPSSNRKTAQCCIDLIDLRCGAVHHFIRTHREGVSEGTFILLL